jgi:Txe/YoeB family toxin of Txe-Axe toxin-antitoxin module
VGAIKYNKTTKKQYKSGKRSNKKVKNRISEINIIEPGNPKKINKLIKHNKNSFGHKKFKPLTSVISLVLNRRAIASTNKNELVDKSA